MVLAVSFGQQKSLQVLTKPLSRHPRVTYWVGLNPPYQGQLLGRRILYRDPGNKPIKCADGTVGCHYRYERYRGLEYRLEVYPRSEEETGEKTDATRVSGREKRSEHVGLRKQGLSQNTGGMTRQQKLDYYQQQVQGRTLASEAEVWLPGLPQWFQDIMIEFVIPALARKIVSHGSHKKSSSQDSASILRMLTIVHMIQKWNLVH